MKQTKNFKDRRIEFVRKIQIEYSLISAFVLLFLGIIITLLLTGVFVNGQQKTLVWVIVVPILSLIAATFMVLALSYRKVKKELCTIKNKETETIEVEILKVRSKQYPVNRFTFIVSCLTIYYRIDNVKYKGYYVPEIQLSPYTLKKITGKAKLTLYKDSKIIETISKDLKPDISGIKYDLI